MKRIERIEVKKVEEKGSSFTSLSGLGFGRTFLREVKHGGGCNLTYGDAIARRIYLLQLYEFGDISLNFFQKNVQWPY